MQTPDQPTPPRRKGPRKKLPQHRRSENLNVRMSPVEIDAFYLLAIVKDVEASVLARGLLMRAVRREQKKRRTVKP